MKYLYGIQPTGRVHLGNYLGGLKMALEDPECEIMIATYHSWTKSREYLPLAEMIQFFDSRGWKYTLQKEKALTLAWEIQCVTPMSDLERMTQFKSKNNPNVGLFTYPCLMAADIILSDCDAVIVGEDQIQHMEFYRRSVKRLKALDNHIKIAETTLTETPRIMSIKDPTKKMSKSLGDAHCLYLGDHEENRKKVMKAPTTPEGIENLKQIARGLYLTFSEDEIALSKSNIIRALELI